MYDNTIEIWKDIQGYEKLYQVSNLGEVTSLTRICEQWNGRNWCERMLEGKTRKQGNMPGGYKNVTLCKDGKLKTFWVHVLVLEAFVGKCPKDMECCHKDGNAGNNNLDNLQWGTPKKNQADRHEHGTANTSNGRDRMNPEKVLAIRRDYISGSFTQMELSSKYEVSRITIYNIVHNKTWKNLH